MGWGKRGKLWSGTGNRGAYHIWTAFHIKSRIKVFLEEAMDGLRTVDRYLPPGEEGWSVGFREGEGG